MFCYDCHADDCEGEMEGSFGEPVQCPVCKVWWETDWDYTSYDSMSAWITGRSDEFTKPERET